MTFSVTRMIMAASFRYMADKSYDFEVHQLFYDTLIHPNRDNFIWRIYYMFSLKHVVRRNKPKQYTIGVHNLFYR